VGCVGGDHRSGEVEVGQQRLEGGDLLWGAAYLLLGQHGAGGMVHRGEQVDLALAVVGCAAGAAEGLAVDRDRPSLPSSLIMVVAMVVAAGKPCADRCGQGLGVKPGEGAADRGFGRDRPDPSAGAGIASGAERGTDRLGCVGGPFGDRGDRPRTGQDRGSGEHENGNQRVPAPGASPGVGDGSQIGEQLRRFSWSERTGIAERGQARQDRG